jgi:carbamoyltransferase
MNLLSISFGHDGSAAVFRDGRMTGAIATERITRTKKQRGVTPATIEYVLQQAELRWSDLHLVVVTNWFWDVVNGRECFDKAAAGMQITHPNGAAMTRDEYLSLKAQRFSVFGGPLQFRMGNHRAACIMVDHHFAHAAYAYQMSPYDDAIVVTIDGGDNAGTTNSAYHFADANKLALRLAPDRAFPVGVYYGDICDYLGFYPALTDAGKVMALAAYGKPAPAYETFCWDRVLAPQDIFAGDQYLHTLLHHGVRRLPRQRTLWPQLPGEGGKPDPAWLDKKDWNQPLNRDIAATAQAVLETSIRAYVDELAQRTRFLSRNLCLSGGTMLNCVSNGKLLHSGLFDNVFVAPACGDDGVAIGAGLHVAAHFGIVGNGALADRTAPRARYSYREAFEGGRRYSMGEIQDAMRDQRAALDAAGVTVNNFAEPDLLDRVVLHIVADRIVGWFHRGSELGPRALGHRSLLANPRNPKMKDLLNSRVKHREEFRPFAPVVPIEHAQEWFDLPPGTASPFMLFSVACKRPAEIPSAVHIDGSARVQTVDRDNNGRFYDLVVRLGAKTGVPVVLNTSFNDQGEPIVESPADAIRCFLGTEIDVLVLEDFVLEKRAAS